MERGRKRTEDCKAKGEPCIESISRGAQCKPVEQDTGPGSGDASPCTDSKTSETGFCTSTGVAIWCDTTESEPITKEWDCKDEENKTCAVGQVGCATGASCCAPEGTPPPEIVECGDVTFAGSCTGENETVATWCENGALKNLDCGALNKNCEEDSCETGAYCCGVTSDATPEQLMCAELGKPGKCDDDKMGFTWCYEAEIVPETCTGTQVCAEDTCGAGAWCCEPAPPPPVNECTTIGYAGICLDGAGEPCTGSGCTTVKYCDGIEVSDIEEFDCSGGKTCQVDATGDADCRDVLDPCDSLGIEGECLPDNSGYQYCIGSTFYDPVCTGDKTCCTNSGGFATCCD